MTLRNSLGMDERLPSFVAYADTRYCVRARSPYTVKSVAEEFLDSRKLSEPNEACTATLIDVTFEPPASSGGSTRTRRKPPPTSTSAGCSMVLGRESAAVDAVTVLDNSSVALEFASNNALM